MSKGNADLMKMARETLRGKWGLAIGTSVVYILIVGVLQAIPYLKVIATLLLTGPMVLGLAVFFLSLSRGQEFRLVQIFEGFKNFGTSVAAYLLLVIFILLWMLLLIIPGIIACLSYSMTFFILADQGSIGAMEAIKKSKKMMDGYKWKYFCMELRFLGLGLLCILTLGIGFLWLFPYAWVSMAKFYDDVKGDHTPKEEAPLP